MQKIAVLFARSDSIYKKYFDLDVYDEERDARTFDRAVAVIAHPPCRLFGKLKQFSKAPPAEKLLAYDALQHVKRCGGILEHPSFSSLWTEKNLPSPGVIDSVGGFTMPILQSWFGHKAPKATWLYIVGISPGELPPYPMQLGIPTGRISNNGSMKFREGTPIELAKWLVKIAQLIEDKKHV